MNISRKNKHHIWTVVVRKSRVFYLLASLLCLVFLHFMAKLPRSVEKKVFVPLANRSLKGEFKSQNVLDVLSHVTKPDVEGVLRISSPVFHSELSRKSNPENTDEAQTQSKTENLVQKNNIPQKSIVSRNLEITNATSFEVDVQSLSNTKTEYKAAESGAKVLIVHTHGCETYSSQDGTALGGDGGYRTTDKEKNVTAVGQILANELKGKGISVIFDDTLCDYPAYNSSYKSSMELIEKHKKENPDIRFVFDIHRDAISESDGRAVGLVAKVKGDLCAQVMVVCGTDASGLYHPNWRENLSLGLKIQKKLEEKYPGIARPLNLREERFNMHETTGSLIFEIGTHGNTLEEAKRSAVFLADAIYEVICN